MKLSRFGPFAVAAAVALASFQGLAARAPNSSLPTPSVTLGLASSPISPAHGPFVAAANPLAVQAGLDTLNRGCSPGDAAVAIQAILGLVEPQSSGLGGGSFMMIYDAATKETTA